MNSAKVVANWRGPVKPVELLNPGRVPLKCAGMRPTFRLLLGLALSGSLAIASIPREPVVPEPEKTDCCAKMKVESASHECDRHAPRPDPDKQCCTTCAFGLAGIVAAATSFVYPPVGDEIFAAYISSEHTRSHQPPVPPPRA